MVRKKKAAKQAQIVAAADQNIHPPPTNELPTYQDAKDRNAVEVSAYQQPLVFSQYQPSVPGNLHPVELYSGEDQDRFTPMPEVVPERSPALGRVSPSRFSETSYNTGARSPSLEPMTPLTPGGRHSRQSDVSRGSVGGPSPRLEGGRLSRQSEVSGPSEP